MKFNDEEVLEKIAKAYCGDDYYISNLPKKSPNF